MQHFFYGHACAYEIMNTLANGVVFFAVLFRFVGISRVTGCQDRLRNVRNRVGWGIVKLIHSFSVYTRVSRVAQK